MRRRCRYNVLRSTDGGATYTQIAASVSGTAYADTTANNGISTQYTITSNSGASGGGSGGGSGGSGTATTSAPSTPTAPAVAGGVWVAVADSTGNPITITPSIADASGATFGGNLPAGTYRVDYAGGTMSYSGPGFGNFPNTEVNHPDGHGFYVTGNSDGGSIETNPSGSTQAFHASGSVGVQLIDYPYNDNVAGPSGSPAFALAVLATGSVSSLSFGAVNATDFHAVYQDGTSFVYDGVQWQAGGVRDYPICYTRSGVNDQTTMTVAASFNVAGFVGNNFKIRGTWDGQTATADATLNNGVLSGTVTETNPMVATVDVHSTDITWQVSPDGGTTWIDAGKTSNKTYVTNGNPTGDQLLETVLNTGCVAAQGKSDYSGIVNSIWAAFQSRSIARVDGAPMHYWGSIASVNPNAGPDTDFTTAGLIEFADGRCEAWSHFLVDVWGAQGVAANYTAIIPNATAYATAPGVQVGATLDGFIVSTTAAQNGNASRADFQSHAVVKLAGGASIYDPSYGQYFPTEQAWRDGMESVFVYNNPDGTQKEPQHVPGQNDSTFK